MIGSGLKKLAQEHGMKVGHGIAYGNMGGFAASMSEGSGFKQITFATKLMDPVKKDGLMQAVNSRNISREFRVKNLGISVNAIQIVFLDNPGTMKKIQEFLAWFLPLLREYGATGMNVCPECGCEVISGRWVMINGVAYYMHDSCAQKAARDIEGENAQRRDQATGSYGSGLAGALLGALVGAVVWAIVLKLGYVASLVGLLIGWLASKGYDLLKGKQGKGKVVILIFAIIFGVLVGTFGGEFLSAMELLNDGELPGYAIGDLPSLILLLFLDNSEYMAAVIKNILMGLLFAGLGVFALLKNTGAAVAGTKITYLD